MELIEREEPLALIESKLSEVRKGAGHTVFVRGEAGIGKTALINSLCQSKQDEFDILLGACDGLFTPRPLAPVYDVLLKISGDLPVFTNTIEQRAELFGRIFHEISLRNKKTILIFEDIHWADEATLDFINFFARRISRLPCLFLLTYRNNEITSKQSLRVLLGHLPAGSFSRLKLPPLSMETVKKMADDRGFDGNEIFAITAGNPFYVTEVLSDYSPGVPANVKDSILSIYHRLEEKSKQVWQLLSVIPTSFEITYLEKLEPLYAEALEQCLEAKILSIHDGRISFKHELYRRTIEHSMSPFKKVIEHKRILGFFLEAFIEKKEIERIIHHAKNANENGLVVQYAPVAAAQASAIGSHKIASKLLLTAIDYHQGQEPTVLMGLYESYAKECCVLGEIQEALIYTQKTLDLLQSMHTPEKLVELLLLNSLFYWLNGDQAEALKQVNEAESKTLENLGPKSDGKVFSWKAELQMHGDELHEAFICAAKTRALGEELDHQELLAAAWNNLGSIAMKSVSTYEEGILLLNKCIVVAKANGFNDELAKCYLNIVINEIVLKNFDKAEAFFSIALEFCDEKDLPGYKGHLLAWQSRLLLEKGDPDGAVRLAEDILLVKSYPAITRIVALTVAGAVAVRRGEESGLGILKKAFEKALTTGEVKMILPAAVALLEQEWISGQPTLTDEELSHVRNKVELNGQSLQKCELSYWLFKVRKVRMELKEYYRGYETSTAGDARTAAEHWKSKGCPMAQAYALTDGSEDEKRNSLRLLQSLGAKAVFEKVQALMRTEGVARIPRGLRKTTQANPAYLTDRELDILPLLKDGLQNKEIAEKLFISPKTVDHHISSILLKLDVTSRIKAVTEAIRLEILK